MVIDDHIHLHGGYRMALYIEKHIREKHQYGPTGGYRKAPHIHPNPPKYTKYQKARGGPMVIKSDVETTY